MSEIADLRFSAQWIFALDDAAYEVGLGVRALALPECVVPQDARDDGFVGRSAAAHGVQIRSIAVEGGEMYEIAAVPLVFEVLDAVRALGDARIEHALTGLLLGYAPSRVQEFCDRVEPR